MTIPFSFDDISVGQVKKTSSHYISAEAIKRFATEYDPQPMHLDERAAQAGPFGRLVASGWHTLSLTMRLMVEAEPFGPHPFVGVAVDSIQFHKPVDAESTIFARAEVKAKRRSIKLGRGFVKMKVETLDARTGEVLITQVWNVMVPAD